MLTLQDCLVIIDEAGNDVVAVKVLVGKFKKMQALNVAEILVSLVEEYDMEELVSLVLNKLDTMPINYFDSILEHDSILFELYN